MGIFIGRTLTRSSAVVREIRMGGNRENNGSVYCVYWIVYDNIVKVLDGILGILDNILCLLSLLYLFLWSLLYLLCLFLLYLYLFLLSY